jgi:hypothetical protein
MIGLHDTVIALQGTQLAWVIPSSDRCQQGQQQQQQLWGQQLPHQHVQLHQHMLPLQGLLLGACVGHLHAPFLAYALQKHVSMSLHWHCHADTHFLS